MIGQKEGSPWVFADTNESLSSPNLETLNSGFLHSKAIKDITEARSVQFSIIYSRKGPKLMLNNYELCCCFYLF